MTIWQKKLTIWVFLLASMASTAHAQSYDTLRVATYNLLNYPGSNSAVRNPEFRKILRAIDPDVLIVSEMQSSAGVTEFLGQVLNFEQPGVYSSATFSNGPDTDNAFFYKSSQVSLQGQVVLSTALRDINGYVVRPAGVTADSLDFRIYSAHLKASQGFESEREAEATILRDHFNLLGPGHYIFGGDFNLYTSTEPAYTVLLGSQADNDGRLYDVLNQPGSWHNSVGFAGLHTQSPRLVDQGDGGSTGGLDDRFDFLLPTYPFQSFPSWQIVANSYTEYGNDGSHFGQAINNGTNFAVPDSIADALLVSSDHLPVFMNIVRQVSPSASVALSQPNGGQSIGEGDTVSITWSSTNYVGLVSLSLSRTGSGGSYESLINGTTNDGQFSWVATVPATTSARIKIVLDGAPSVNDISDNDFTIFDRDVSLFTPVSLDSFTVGSGVDIQWTSSSVTGNMRVELKRSPSSPVWELLSASTANNGYFGWIAVAPLTDSARVRVLSVLAPTVGDTSGMFRIKSFSGNQPPTISHNPVCDAVPGSVVFYCNIQDDGAFNTPYLIWSSNGFVTSDSLAQSPAALGGFSCSTILAEGHYNYFVRVTDSGNLTARTDTFELAVLPDCQSTISYDDGTAESYQWSENTGMMWAVKFTPVSTPFVLCATEFALSVRKPDSLHGLLSITVLDDDGVGGLPGSTLGSFSCGSLPNLISGSAGTSPGWGRCALQNDGGSPLVVSSDFYVAIEAVSEAFALDETGIAVGRSYLWDTCEAQWFVEDGLQGNTRIGNRMIRVEGYGLVPPVVVISPSGNDIKLHWTATVAPQYAVYRSALPDGPFITPIASTIDTTWTDTGVIPLMGQAFYVVRSVIP